VKAAIYVPHGAIPDRRGFAPAIVAWNHARRLKTLLPVIVSAREDYPGAHEETLLAPKPWTTILNNLQFGSGLPHLLPSDDILVVEQCPKAQGLAAFRVLT
jgi:hypothetical protein